VRTPVGGAGPGASTACEAGGAQRLRRVVLRWLRWLRRRWSRSRSPPGFVSSSQTGRRCGASHETIYEAIYLQARGNLRAELARQVALRSGRAARRPRPAAGGAVRSNRAWPGLHISARPPGRGRRPGGARALGRRPGHRQRRRASAIATLVERATRFVMLVALPEGRVSEHVVSQLAAKMAALPERLRRSLTCNQGIEMARHLQFAIATDCPVYFCDPHSPGSAAATKTPTACDASITPKARPTSAPSPRPTSSCLRVVTHCPATTSTQGRSESGKTESCASGLGRLA
jgi:IS30 family transposase